MAIYAVQVLSEQAQYEQLLGGTIGTALAMAAELDDMPEREAVGALMLEITGLGLPAPVLALAVAALSIRMHRTQQTSAALNSPEPGQ